MQKRKKPRALVAIPHVGNVRAELALWCMNHDPCGCEVKLFYTSERPISVNRKKIRRVFLESGFEWLLQIDSDMGPPLDLLRMVHNGVDVCSANIATVKGCDIIPLAMEDLGNGEYRVKPGEGLFEVDAVGTGCLLTSRAAMEAVPYSHVTDEIRAIDFEWCARARAAGFGVWFDGRLKCPQFTTVAV